MRFSRWVSPSRTAPRVRPGRASSSDGVVADRSALIARSSRSRSGRPPVIGLVGGIGAGKSLVASMLRERGCLVSDSDALAHEAMRDPEVIECLRARWGAAVFAPDGLPDRAAVARLVFEDAHERRWLESIIHPWINARRQAAFAVPPPGTAALVIDAPLLLEAGLDETCDAVIFVESPQEIRLERVRSGRGWSEAELRKRESAQLPLDRKRERADIVIVNAGNRQWLEQQVGAALEAILERHHAP